MDKGLARMIQPPTFLLQHAAEKRFFSAVTKV